MPRAKLLLEPLPPALRWLTLIAGSTLIAAALMGVQLPRPLLYGAQAVIGCMIARALTPEILAVFVQRWPIFIGVIAAVVGVASLIGAAMTRWRILPGTTA